MSFDEIPIGPNPCHLCGGEYGEHSPECKSRRAEPDEVSMLDVILENIRLKGQVFMLKERVAALEEAEVKRSASERAATSHDSTIAPVVESSPKLPIARLSESAGRGETL